MVEIVVVLFLDVGGVLWKAKSGVEKEGKESKELKEDSAWQRRKKRRQEAGAEEQQVESDEEVATEIVSEEEEEEDKEIDDEEEEEPKEEPKKSKKTKTDSKTKSKKKSKKEPNEECSLVIAKFLSIWQFEQKLTLNISSGKAVPKESVSAQVCLKSAHQLRNMMK